MRIITALCAAIVWLAAPSLAAADEPDPAADREARESERLLLARLDLLQSEFQTKISRELELLIAATHGRCRHVAGQPTECRIFAEAP